MGKAVSKLKCRGGKVKSYQMGGLSSGFGKTMEMLSPEAKKAFAEGKPVGPYLEQEKEGLGSEAKSAITGMGAEAVSTMLTSALDAIKSKAESEYDPRTDPTEMMRKSSGVDIASDIGKSTLKGVAAGAALGPVGMAVGAGAGLLASGAKAIFGSGERKRKQEEAKLEWQGAWADKYFAGRKQYAKGGKIKGPGGAKSDKISMNTPDGSFIVPAENAGTAIDLGREYLGWNDESVAKMQNGGSKIKVSNGEVLFTPEEVDRLELAGIDLNTLAPNAEPENRLAKGGKKYPSKAKSAEMLENPPHGRPLTPNQEKFFRALAHGWTPDRFYKKGGIYIKPSKRGTFTAAAKKHGAGVQEFASRVLSNKENYSPAMVKKANFARNASKWKHASGGIVSGYENGGYIYDKETGMVIPREEYDKKYPPSKVESISSVPERLRNPQIKKSDIEVTETPNKWKERKEKAIGFLPELLALTQMKAAWDGIKSAGERPDLLISDRIKRLAEDTRQAATYGMEPAVKNAYLRNIELTRRDMMSKLASRGGSPQEIYEALAGITSKTLEAKGKIPVMEEQMMLQKKGLNIDVEKTLAAMKYDKSRVESDLWHQYQENWANLLTSGIGNFIGARQMKENLAFMKDVGMPIPTFTAILDALKTSKSTTET